jgi:hypothetical protein
VKAVANYVTRESTLLSFHKGDVIQVVRDEQYVDKGKLFHHISLMVSTYSLGKMKRRRYAVVQLIDVGLKLFLYYVPLP